MKQTAELNLAGSGTTRPSLLTTGLFGSTCVGVTCLLFLILAPFDIGTYTVNDRTVSGPEFMRAAGVFMATIGIVCVSVAYGLWRERSWTRPLMMMFWVVIGAEQIAQALVQTPRDASTIILTILWLAICLVAASAYLYGNDGVAAYYRTLKLHEESETSAP